MALANGPGRIPIVSRDDQTVTFDELYVDLVECNEREPVHVRCRSSRRRLARHLGRGTHVHEEHLENMAVGIRESAVVHPSHIHGLAHVRRAAGSARLICDGVDVITASAGESEQDLARLVRVRDRFWAEGRDGNVT